MRRREELWLLEDAAIDESSDLLSLSEVKERLTHDHDDEDLGVRSLLERPEVLKDLFARRR